MNNENYGLYEKGYNDGFKIGYEKAIEETNKKLQKFKEDFEKILKIKYVEYMKFHADFKKKLDEIKTIFS